MRFFSCPFCHQPISSASPTARAFVFNVAVRRVVPDATRLRAGDVLVVVDSTLHPEDHSIHRCDDPRGTVIVDWFRQHAMDAYAAINSAIRQSLAGETGRLLTP